jgi:FtsH-binding integral membrane protein
LIGLIGIQVSGLAMSWITGNMVFLEITRTIDIYGGLALFTALNAIETHTAIKMYEEKQADVLGCALNSTLNAVNIFLRLLQIFGERDKK